MVGMIDGKTIRETKGTITVDAVALAGGAFVKGAPGIFIASTNGTLVAINTALSATTNTIKNGRWGIANDVIASTETGKFTVAGVAPTIDVIASGNIVIAICANGSIIASATVASTVGEQGLGRFASSLLDTDGGMIIW